MQVTYRAGRAEDHPALLALMRRAALANEGDREMLTAHPELITLPIDLLGPETSVVAEENGVPVGFATLSPSPGHGDEHPLNEIELDALFVDPAHWRAGIGGALMGEVRRLAGAGGATAIRVIANPHADAFYAASGFVAVDTIAVASGTARVLRLLL